MDSETSTPEQHAHAAATWHTDTPVPKAADSRLSLQLASLSALSPVRRQVRAFLQASLEPPGGTAVGGRDEDAEDDAVERAILVIDELASNALRHGLPPSSLHVCDDVNRWMVMVTDSAPQRRPTPALDRPAEQGGFGLYVVADLTAAHGVHYEPTHKTVWVCLNKPA